MSMSQAMLSEFENEAVTTKRFLERLPADKLTWKPHEKSMTAGQLALHIAAGPAHVLEMANQDTMPPPDFSRPNPQPQSVAEVLQAHENSLAAVRRILPTFDDPKMQQNWQIKADDKVIMSMPRAAMLRMILLNHIYHHRGQFGVYLRLMGAKVPSSYGPSGDELPPFMK
jgi:uncharacterized damage-inducible protein DinB